jgi:GH24 family phage-related lysozyme (muramidase)
MSMSSQGAQMLGEFEFVEGFGRAAGIVAVDSKDRMIGIYPHYVFREILGRPGTYESDGGITMGYGIFISQGSFNQNTEHRRLIDTYASGASFVPPHIPSDGLPFRVPNSIHMSLVNASELKKTTLQRFEDAVNDFLQLHNVRVTQYQFDVLVSFTYNFGENVWFQAANENWDIYRLISNGTPFNSREVRDAFGRFPQNQERRAREAEVFINGY